MEGAHFFVKCYQIVSLLLDPPNIHRLLELNVHTFSLYGHALFVSDAIFEANHQPLKALLAKKYHEDNYITAAYQMIASDSLRKVYEARKLTSSSICSPRRVLYSLQKLLFGKLCSEIVRMSELARQMASSSIDSFSNDMSMPKVEKPLPRCGAHHSSLVGATSVQLVCSSC